MSGRNGFAVYFFPQAVEALGAAIQPYLQEGPGGPCVQCHEVDTGGAFIDLTQHGRDADGNDVQLELMVPSAMVRMIVSIQSDAAFGFGPRGVERPLSALPVLGPTAPPADAPSQGLPRSADVPQPPVVDAPAPPDAVAVPGPAEARPDDASARPGPNAGEPLG